MLTDQLVINLSPEDKSLLRSIACEQEMPLAAVTRRIIRAELARLREAAERPADLPDVMVGVLFADILRLIAELRPPPVLSTA
jgi:hypothetical protein